MNELPRRAVLRRALQVTLLALSMRATADDQDTIDYRQHVMKTLGEQLAAVNMILSGKAPPQSFATHLQVLATAAGQARKAFEPRIPGGKSKPEVWSSWPDFAQRLDALTAASGDLAKAAGSGPTTLGPRIKASLDCEGCHRIYMLPGKPQ